MKGKKPNAAQIWKQFEDLLVPRLRISVNERAVYSHLLRHSRLEGRGRLRISLAWLARGARLSLTPVRKALRSLAGKGALRIVERSKAGHVIEMLLPEEIRMARESRALPAGFDIESADVMANRELREAIHRREGGRCFYCLRQVTRQTQALDHVVPRVRGGDGTYRNVVSCCAECNSEKGERNAEDFLRQLYRQRLLKPSESLDRMQALEALAKGKRKPTVSPPPSQFPRLHGKRNCWSIPTRPGRRRVNP
jgi:hypothetical protein